tara:strand:- start:183 stop:485 length:303 start_codon:yes stop_codon:yes gene_type:complete
MVRSEIVSRLSNKIHKKLTKSEIEKIIKIILHTIISGVKQNKNAEFRKFGTFSVKNMKEKSNARNPKTNEKIFVPQKISIKFKMANELKNFINKKKETIN